MNGKISCTALFLDSDGGWSDNSDSPCSYVLFKKPEITLSYDNGILYVNSEEQPPNSNKDPLEVLENYIEQGYIAVGYIGYEFSAHTDAGFRPVHSKEGNRYPDIFFHLYRENEINKDDQSKLSTQLNLRVTKNQDYNSLSKGNNDSYISNMSKHEYIDNVLLAKRYIKSGDIYQVNLSQRFSYEAEYSPISYFLKLFHVQHVPFGCYIDFGRFQLVSGSMELFVRRNGKRIVTKPIKGTAGGNKSSEQSAINRAKLLASEKERAENLMIVDLMRSDLSRVCESGSVKVNRLFDIESYSTLHQMVSEVQGVLKDKTTFRDVIINMFPPGSVTGAPKKRALEIIDQIEPHYRGPYCGTLGILYPNGDFTLSVGIRVLLKEEQNSCFWVGSGIVWDSDPEKEYEETLLKAMAIKKAFDVPED